MTAELTYPEVGATHPDRGSPLPGGYSYLHERTYVGQGEITQAAELMRTWQMHRAAGIRVLPPSPRAEPGVEVVARLGVGPLATRHPTRVVWVLDEDRRKGFAYGTLPGHPECGEEAFLLEQDDEGRTWLTVTAFSRPAAWYTRLAGPVGRWAQAAMARRLGRVLRKLAAEA